MQHKWMDEEQKLAAEQRREKLPVCEWTRKGRRWRPFDWGLALRAQPVNTARRAEQFLDWIDALRRGETVDMGHANPGPPGQQLLRRIKRQQVNGGGG